MKTRIFIFILAISSFYGIATPQKSSKVTISGVVRDIDGKPVVNAIIMIDGINTSSKTDTEGKYRVKTKADALKIGVFTFGLGMHEEDIKGRTRIDFRFGSMSTRQNLSDDIPAGDEATNVGYATVRKKDVTTQVSKIDATEKRYASYKSVAELIEREVSGVRISGSGFVIQDSKNLQGSIPALLILDGTYVDSFSGISPSMVKSVEVLKGTSGAMYGSRGYGGVIIVTTKIEGP